MTIINNGFELKTDKIYRGRIHIEPKVSFISPFQVPADQTKSTYFVIKLLEDGEIYLYDGKTQESAASSYNIDMVTILQAEEI